MNIKLPWSRAVRTPAKSETVTAVVMIDFDKNEDMTEGLIMEGTIRITAENISNYIEYLPEDLAFLPKNWFDTSVSCCFISDDEIKGMHLIHRLPSGKFFIDMLAAMGGDPNVIIINLMRFSIAALYEMDPKAEIIFRRNNEKRHILSDKMFPGKKSGIVCCGNREEA